MAVAARSRKEDHTMRKMIILAGAFLAAVTLSACNEGGGDAAAPEQSAPTAPATPQ